MMDAQNQQLFWLRVTDSEQLLNRPTLSESSHGSRLSRISLTSHALPSRQRFSAAVGTGALSPQGLCRAGLFRSRCF
jgi:hypothetical protein